MPAADKLSIIEYGQGIAYPHPYEAPALCGIPVSQQDFLVKINVGRLTTADVSIEVRDDKLVVAAARRDEIRRHFEFSRNNERSIIIPFRKAPQCIKGYLRGGVLTLKYQPHREAATGGAQQSV